MPAAWTGICAGATTATRALGGGLAARPTANIELVLGPRYSRAFRDAQWVENIDDDGDDTDDHFVYGELRTRTLDLTTRANIIFGRDLSLEIYVQPFLTVGDYDNFKELARPASYQFAPRSAPEDNPDFRRRSLQSNLVLRWEYHPGSTLFLVWSQSRSDSAERPRFRPLRDLGLSFADDGSNIFLAKTNYWLDI